MHARSPIRAAIRLPRRKAFDTLPNPKIPSHTLGAKLQSHSLLHSNLRSSHTSRTNLHLQNSPCPDALVHYRVENRKYIAYAFATIVISCLCQSPASAQSNDLTTVRVAKVQRDSTADHGRYVGRVEAIKTVDIKARVTGILEKRDFTEGGKVKKGQLLYVIEKALYLADVAKAKANVAGANANIKNSKKILERERTLRTKGDIAQSSLDAAQAKFEADVAISQQHKAELDTANINLSYTDIHSPIDGRISKTNVDVGNLIESSTGTLATVVSLDPIYVTFYVSEKTLTADRQRGLMGPNDSSLDIKIKLSDGSEYPHGGRIDYIWTEIDRNTDTVELRAKFPNPKSVLIPNQFVSVSVSSDQSESSLLIPQPSVQYDKNGHFVYTLDKSNRVVRTSVILGQQIAGNWQVKSGLRAGQSVIVQGLQRVRPGDTVKPVERQN
ncbi:MAG: efflux RND transporter periplasmic adaptor subunit [Hyphomicrobiaceae bacterium]